MKAKWNNFIKWIRDTWPARNHMVRKDHEWTKQQFDDMVQWGQHATQQINNLTESIEKLKHQNNQMLQIIQSSIASRAGDKDFAIHNLIARDLKLKGKPKNVQRN